MYLSNKKIYFHSVFNDKTIFGKKDTKIFVPIDNIKAIEKKTNAKIFDNSIEI